MTVLPPMLTFESARQISFSNKTLKRLSERSHLCLSLANSADFQQDFARLTDEAEVSVVLTKP